MRVVVKMHFEPFLTFLFKTGMFPYNLKKEISSRESKFKLLEFIQILIPILALLVYLITLIKVTNVEVGAISGFIDHVKDATGMSFIDYILLTITRLTSLVLGIISHGLMLCKQSELNKLSVEFEEMTTN